MNLMKKILTQIRLWGLKVLAKFGFKPKEIYYIGGKTSLPAPLSKAEEQECLERLMEEDPDARATLIERNLRLVVYIAKKFENTGIHLEDLIRNGSIGLIKAVNTFNPEKKIKLATYASRCIENEILRNLRKSNSMKTEVSFDEPLNLDSDGNALVLSYVLGTVVEFNSKVVVTKVDMQLIIGAASTLHPLQQ